MVNAMQIRIIAVGDKMPDWVITGFNEYAKRLSNIKLVEISAEKRNKNASIEQIKQREGEKILSVISSHHHVIALDVQGKLWSTEKLAENVKQWQTDGRPIDLLIGGPDGLAPACLQKAETLWSLSSLTLPHPLVRIVLIEQLYRADSILKGHPYHR